MLEFPKKSAILSILFFLSTVAIVMFILAVPLRIGEYRGFSVKIVSPTAEGLGVGSAVVISGVQVGRVSKIELSEDGRRAIITVQLKDGVKIARDSKVEFRMKGVLGDRIIAFIQGEKIHDYLKDGDVLIIEEGRTELSQIFGSIEDTSQKLSRALESIMVLSERATLLVDNINEFISEVRNSGIGDELRASSTNLRRTTKEAYHTVENINQLVSEIRKLVEEIKPDVKDFSEEMTQVAKNLNTISKEIGDIVQRAESDGFIQVFAGKSNTEKLEKIIDELDNIRPRISRIAERAEKMTSGIRTEIGGRIEGGIQKDHVVASQHIGAKIGKNGTSVEVGISSPPMEDRITLSAVVSVSVSEHAEFGLGFIRSRPSFIAELKPIRPVFLRTEGIGFNELNLRALIGGRYGPFGIYGGVENLLLRDKLFLIGIELRR